MQRDATTRELVCTVVYVGPGMAGKSTNLAWLHDHPEGWQPGELKTEDQESQRLLTLDLRPEALERVHGCTLRFRVRTVPGRSYYAAARRDALLGADGIVFVCDSRREAMDENIEAMNDLYDGLRHHQIPEALPTVIQFNKQDLASALRIDQLNPLLNHRNLPSTRACASAGEGVAETFRQVTSLILDRLREQDRLPEMEHVPAPRPAAPPPAAAARPEPSRTPADRESWLLTCHHCQELLEVPRAAKGDVFTCGSCNSPLQVVDADRGITAPFQPGEKVNLKKDISYGMQALPDPERRSAIASAAAGAAPLPPVPAAPLPGAPQVKTVMPGLEVVAELDDSPMGRRIRVRDTTTTNAFHRALLLKDALLRQPGFEPQLEPRLRLASMVRHKGVLTPAGLRRHGGVVAVLSADAPEHQPLTHLLSRRNILQAPQAMGIVRQIALTLDEASRHGLIHGWLRPDVVLIGGDGTVLIDDLGVPKPHDYLLRESVGSSAATEHYLAPEHAQTDLPIDARSDMFLLGAILFRMVTGQALVTGYSSHEALARLRAGGLRSLRSVTPGISRDLDTFCSRLTSLERQGRFDSYRELIDRLDAFGGGARRNTLQVTRGLPAAGTGSLRASGIDRSPLRSAVLPPVENPRGTGPLPPPSGGTSRHAAGPVRPLTRTIHSSHAHPAAATRPHPPKGGGGVLILFVILAIGLCAVAAWYWYTHVHPAQARMLVPKSSEGDPAPGGTSVVRETRPPSAGGTTSTTATTPLAPATPRPGASSPAAALVEQARQVHDAFLRKTDDAALLQQALAAIQRAMAADATESERQMLGGMRANLMMRDTSGSRPTTRTGGPEVAATTPAGAGASAAPVLAADVQARLDNLLAAERFAEARREAERLVADAGLRSQSLARIDARHRALQAGLQRVLDRNVTLEQARRTLDGPLQVWGVPEDERLAQALLKAKTEMAAATAAPETPTAPAADQRTPSGLLLAAVRADLAVDASLLSGDVAKAEAAIASLGQAVEAGVLRRKVAWWNQRAEIVAGALAKRHPKLRVSPPISPLTWDVLGAGPAGLRIRNPAGTEMDLAWTSVKTEELGNLFVLAGAGDDLEPIERAVCASVAVMTGQIGPAEAHLGRLRTAAVEDAAALEGLIAFWREREVVALVDRAEACVRANDTNGLAEALAQLQQPRFARNEGLAATLARLRERLDALRAGKTVGPVLADALDFSKPAHLDAFTEQRGTWMVADGMAANDGDASLARSDAGNARSLTVRFLAKTASGGLTICLRGIRVVIDLGQNRFQVQTPQDRRPDVPFPFKTAIVHTVHLAVLDDGRAHIEINQADPIELNPGRLGSQVQIQTDSGAHIALDEVQIKRVASTAPAAGTAVDQDVLRTALGLVPLGGAYKDPASPAIILPAPVGGVRSGFALALKPSMAGVSLTVRSGDGPMLVGLAGLRNDQPVGDLSKFDPPKPGEPPLILAIRWAAGACTIDLAQAGEDPARIKSTLGADTTHLFVLATKSAIIASSPTIERP